MGKNIWITILVLTVCTISINSEREIGPKPRVPNDTLFQDPAAFCEGCYALVHEMDKLLSRWSKEKGSLENQIEAALLAVCSTERLRSYVLSPPKMERLCSGIRANYEEEIALAFVRSYGQKNQEVDKVFAETCRKAIPACPMNIKPMSVVRQEQREMESAEKAAKESPSDTDAKNKKTNEGEKTKNKKTNEGEKTKNKKTNAGEKTRKDEKKDKSKTKKKNNKEQKKDEL